MTDNDLPLLSNINDIRARHYLIDLKPSFSDKVFRGKVIIFFEITTPCERRGKCCTRKCFCLVENVTLNEKTLQEKFQESHNHCKTATQNNSVREVRESDAVSYSENLEVDFELTLDCCDIKVKRVTEVLCSKHEISEYLDPNFIRQCKHGMAEWTSKEQLPLQFSVSQWCVKIAKPGIKNVQNFPQIVCIEYETSPHGKSVLWRNDQDGNPCVFTPAASINNRSLLPCQDPPSAMATWQSWITVPDGFYVSITGDEPPKFDSINDSGKETSGTDTTTLDISQAKNLVNEVPQCEDVLESNSTVCFYYYTSMVLPIATIAIAIGKWEAKSLVMPKFNLGNIEDETIQLKETCEFPEHICKHYEYPCHLNSEHWSSDTQLTMVYPVSLCENIKPLSDFLPFAVKAAVQLLGTYPCRRVEVVILPQSFGSLGLASPNLMFLSPTLALKDHAAFIRIAHEVSHAWFGINIGAQDWTEEWISEGFATYMEDLIFTEAILAYQEALHAAVLPVPSTNPFTSECYNYDKVVTEQLLEELSDLRAHLRYRTLGSELENSNEDLQTLRPMQGENLIADGVSFVKDGLNPEKTFLQVHYLKGYFLLKFLRRKVGREKFNEAMHAYVAHYHGQLVSSQDILNYFMEKCPEILNDGITLEYLFNNWLHQPGLTSEIKEMYGTVSNSLALAVRQHYQFWISSNKRLDNRSNKKFNCELENFLFPDQLVLLFEYLLDLPKLHSRTLSNVFDHYRIAGQNADVRHRWCELVIKHNFHDLTEIERFLINDQSMGVYLYGELIISRKPKHKHLARKLFTDNQKDMDENASVTVQAMLYGD